MRSYVLLATVAACTASVPALRAYSTTGARWSTTAVPMHLQLGPAATPLADGSANWGASAEDALATWNSHIAATQFTVVRDSTAQQAQGNRVNNVLFSPTVYGESWGSGVLAVTLTYTMSGGRTTETDVLFNQNLRWDSYRGNLRYTSGGTTFDFHRVALHEFGHALGLDHPDQAGQSVVAVMNSRVSNLDALATDDITGAQSLYGSSVATPTNPPPASSTAGSRLVNLSTRGYVAAGGDLIAGFNLRGSGAKSVLVRGIGPTLSQFSVTGVLADPQLSVVSQATTETLATNDNWAPALGGEFQSVGAFGLPAGSADAATKVSLVPGGYSARVSARSAGGSGLALVEVYDAALSSTSPRLVNLSTRGFTGSGDRVLAVGFTIQGEGAKRVLVRAIGPGLAPYGVAGYAANPRLDVYAQGQSAPLAGNDNWGNTDALRAAFTASGAFPLNGASADAAVILTLNPGSYSVVVTGVGGTTGETLAEIYDLDP